MVWIKWSDYGKPKKKKTFTKSKKTKPKIEPKTKIIPGKHMVEFKKASELNQDKDNQLKPKVEKILEDIDSKKTKTERYRNAQEFIKHIDRVLSEQDQPQS